MFALAKQLYKDHVVLQPTSNLQLSLANMQLPGCDLHAVGSCACILQSNSVSQGLDELDFSRSACSAAQKGQVDKLERILKQNPDSLHTDGVGGSSGYTPLHYAARAGQTKAVELLLRHGANVDATTREGKATCLHRAATAGHLQIIQKLVEHGANGLMQDADKETPLHKACAQDRRGRTPGQVSTGDVQQMLANKFAQQANLGDEG